MLTQRLRELEADGLIIRHDFKTVPPHVEYVLSDTGEKLIPILNSLRDWGEEVKRKTNH